MKFSILAILFIISFSIFSQTNEKFLKWQEKPVLGVAFSPNGKILASVGADKQIKIWDIEKGELISTLYDNVSGEVSISFSPDGTKLVSGSWDQTVKIWDIKTGEVIRRFHGHDKSLRSACYSPSGKFIASAGWDKEIIIWYEPTGLELKRLSGHTQCIRAIDYSPDGKYIASGGYDLYLRIHEVSSGREIFSFKGHRYPIEALSYSPDGKYIATGGNDNVIKLWSTESNKLYKTLSGHTDGVYSVSFSADGRYLASGGNDYTIKIWDVNNGTCIKTIKGHQLTIKSVAFSPNGKILVSGSADKTIRVWDIENLKIPSIEKKPKALSFNEADTSMFKIPVNLKTNLEVFERDFKLKVLVKNLDFSTYKVYVNGTEHFKFNGKDKLPNPPTIKDLGNGFLELTFNLYLFPDDNEIQVYVDKNAQSEFYVSTPIHITYTNLKSLAAKTNLYYFDINPTEYSDKKLNKVYSYAESVDIQHLLNKQQNILYKNINTVTFPEIASLTPTQLNKKIQAIEKPVFKSDVIILSMSGMFLRKQNQFYFLMPNASSKDVLPSVYQLDSLLDILSKKCDNVYLFFNITGTPEIVKGFENVTCEELSKFNFTELFDKKINFTTTCISDIKNSTSKLLSECIAEVNDNNKNKAIEYNEFSKFASQFGKVNFNSKGKLLPFYYFFETSTN